MLRKTRRALGFESLEGKLLLSRGHAVPAAAVHFSAVSHLSITGVLNGLPLPTNSGGQVAAFTASGQLGNMLKVNATFELADPFTYGQSPNLSDATVTLTDRRGTVDLLIAPSKTSTYDYVITGSTRYWSGVTGSGILKVHFSQRLFGLVQVVLHTLPH
jgi:hypothetical protein